MPEKSTSGKYVVAAAVAILAAGGYANYTAREKSEPVREICNDSSVECYEQRVYEKRRQDLYEELDERDMLP